MAATDTMLGELHEALAADFLDMLRNGVEVEDKEGNVTTRKATAAERGVIVTFLHHNNITAKIGEDGALSELADLMAKKRAARKPVLADVHATLPDGFH